jgi:uncharacterized protein (TIRG00374 family)
MKTFLAALVSFLIMTVIFLRIDLGEFRRHLGGIDPLLFGLALAFFIPQVAVSAWRWRFMIDRWCRITLWESSELILAASAINILIPSRVGDLCKAYFIARQGRLDIRRGMNVVLFEKYVDLASLGVVVLTGIACAGRMDSASWLGLAFALGMIGIFPVLYFVRLDRWVSHPKFEENRLLAKVKHFLVDSQTYLDEIKNDPKHVVGILAVSVFLWFLHIAQFHVIFLALHSEVPAFHIYRLVPLAILVGLVPITMAGVGTRDSAMIYFFAPYETASLVAGVGLFSSLRYFLPGLIGLPFMNKYIVAKPAASEGLAP